MQTGEGAGSTLFIPCLLPRWTPGPAHVRHRSSANAALTRRETARATIRAAAVFRSGAAALFGSNLLSLVGNINVHHDDG